MNHKLHKLLLMLLLSVAAPCLWAQPQGPQRPAEKPMPSHRNAVLRTQDAAFYLTDEARRVGDLVLAYQRVTGGWPKNIDMSRPLSDEEMAQVMADKSRRDDSTTDNDATNIQLNYLARLYKATHEESYKDAVQRGVDYLLSGQYANGGWPQFWPEMRGYQIHITFNDNAMVNTMLLLRQIADSEAPFDGKVVDKSTRKKAREAFDKGIECILNTQIKHDGELTVWCQQHDRETLLPAPARAYELPSYCSSESASIVSLLMSLPKPSARVKQAVHAAMRWFDRYKLTGLRVVRETDSDGVMNTRLISDSTGHVMWARFYDLQRCEPYVCDRDGIPRRHLEDIGAERRNGYGWFQDRPAALYGQYRAWAAKHDPQNAVPISLESKGANELGLIEMYRKAQPDRSLFDVVVHPGESIQAAIEQAPQCPDYAKPFKVFIEKGVYNEKVIIDRPNIVLVGEDRDNTIITWAETRDSQKVKEYKGKPVGIGVVVLQEGADDCLISGLTIYNNYGTTVENTTTHQMSVFGRATRTIIVNSTIKADGNDALALWASGGNGMYYHSDLDLICRGVDFLCPRGWCYVTRSHFLGDSRAILWHDGRSDKTQKLVVTNSTFDALSPTPLGRYHHDSQFFIINCQLSSNINDANIRYAYTDKVLDPCPWGLRTYYYGCTREGGHSGWLSDNLDTADGEIRFWDITASWTFNGQWDPEQRLRDLWPAIAYELRHVE